MVCLCLPIKKNTRNGLWPFKYWLKFCSFITYRDEYVLAGMSFTSSSCSVVLHISHLLFLQNSPYLELKSRNEIFVMMLPFAIFSFIFFLNKRNSRCIILKMLLFRICFSIFSFFCLYNTLIVIFCLRETVFRIL